MSDYNAPNFNASTGPTPPDYGRVDGVMNQRRNGSAWEAAFGVNAPLPLTGDELARRDIAEQYWRLADVAVALFDGVLARDGGQQMPASYGSYFGLYNGADSRNSGTGYPIVNLGPRPIDTGYPNSNYTWDVLAQPCGTRLYVPDGSEYVRSILLVVNGLALGYPHARNMFNLDGIVPNRSQKVSLPQPGEADPSQPGPSFSLENVRKLLRFAGVVLDVCAAAAAQNAVASGWEELWQQGHEAHAALGAILNDHDALFKQFRSQ